MSYLSARCEKAVIDDIPAGTGCRKKAEKYAADNCAGMTGYGSGVCMAAQLRMGFAAFCADVVCPGDPAAFMVQGAIQSGRASQARAGEGGGYGAKTGTIAAEAQLDAGGSGGAADARKMRVFLGVGAGLIVVLAVLMMTNKK